MWRWKLQYLVKWEGYGIEHNTWEYSDNLNNAAEAVAEFHSTHPGAPRCIRVMAFGTIPFRPVPLAFTSSQCSSRIVRGTPYAVLFNLRSTHARTLAIACEHLCIRS